MPLPAIVDTHVHLWDPARLPYDWLSGKLKRAYLPADFRAACGPVEVSKIVFVECGCHPAHNLDEVAFVTDLAREEPRIRGIVAHAALEFGDAIRGDLEQLRANPLVRGVRRILQSDGDGSLGLKPDFLRGVRLLPEFGFSFDLCIHHSQLPAGIALARACPETTIVVDHIANPPVRTHETEPWASRLRELAALPNVWCKVSGVATNAGKEHWTREDLKPYLDIVLNAFGFDRCLYGGDWPVATLATDYPRWVETLAWAVQDATPAEQAKLFGGNAERCYRV